MNEIVTSVNETNLSVIEAREIKTAIVTGIGLGKRIETGQEKKIGTGRVENVEAGSVKV